MTEESCDEVNNIFVDWQLKDFEDKYYKEKDKLLKIKHRDTEIVIPQVIYFDNLKHKVDINNIEYKLIDKTFTLGIETKELTERSFQLLYNNLSKNSKLFNGENLRLLNLEQIESKLLLYVQPIRYFDYLHTNLVIDSKLNGREISLREALHNNGMLEDLKVSPLGNNFGVNVLLFTHDGYMIIQKRSDKVAFWQGLYSPSGSGAVTRKDIGNSSNDIIREVIEELNIENSEVSNLKLLGITRELIRGGQPEMFFFALTELTKEDILEKWSSAEDRWESSNIYFHRFMSLCNQELEINIEAFNKEVESFISSYFDKSSMPLITNFSLWVRYITSDKKEDI